MTLIVVRRARCVKIAALRGATAYDMNVNPGNANLPIGGILKDANQEIGVPVSTLAPLSDPLGIPLSEPKVPVFATLGDFQQAQGLMGRLAKLLDRIAQSPAGELYRLTRAAFDSCGESDRQHILKMRGPHAK